MKAWLFQDHLRKEKFGDSCPWSVGWYDPDGKKRSKTIGSEDKAADFKAVIEDRLSRGQYGVDLRKQWKDFRAEYEGKIAEGMSPQNRRCTMEALDHFERIAKPKKLVGIKTQTIDAYVANRRKERGRKADSTVSPATVNKELRHLRAVLRIAKEWKYLVDLPRFRMIREPQKLVRYVTPEHFTAIYEACDVAVRPKLKSCTPAEWWRALLMFCYMTGWRISEPLALRREDLDLKASTAITRAVDNKGKRDERVPLHPVVIEHLKGIQGFEPVVFPWYYARETLWDEFHAIQTAAGIHLACHENHAHTPACHVYGFHDLRRAFASMNATRLSADALQALMRHKAYATTQRYISMARHLDDAVAGLHVPEVATKGRVAK